MVLGIHKKYSKDGTIKGVLQADYYSNQMLRSCRIKEKNEIIVKDMVYIPKYTQDDFRTKYRDNIKFYETGEIKSIYLEQQQEIKTRVGKVKAELVTFYKSGHIKRVFPLYGEVNGFWSQEEEKQQLSDTVLEIKGQILRGKMSCIHFYESGRLKSITLWEDESIVVKSPYGEIEVCKGISFYESEDIESLEPMKPFYLGIKEYGFIASANFANQIHGDINSLQFTKEGNVRALSSGVTSFILQSEHEKVIISPMFKESDVNVGTFELVPISIEWVSDMLVIEDSDHKIWKFDRKVFSLKTTQETSYIKYLEKKKCGDCSSCGSNSCME